jgi:RNA recognition motif-containing protein
MNKKLYVGNLPYNITPEALKELFASAGDVVSVDIVSDRMSGRSKGFGFVEMGTEAEAQQAIETLNGRDVDGRTIKVAEARPPRRDRDDRGFGGGGGGRGRDRDRGGRPRRDDW